MVARNQRERLVAAIAEECAERSHAEVSVAGEADRLPRLEDELAATPWRKSR